MDKVILLADKRKKAKERDAIKAARQVSDAFAYQASVLHRQGFVGEDIATGCVALLGKLLAKMDPTMSNRKLREAVFNAITKIQADQILTQLACDLVDFDEERDR